MHYLLMYDFAPDYLERRPSFRAEHLRSAWAAVERGELLLGGALADPADMGVLRFDCESPAVVERFATSDPYVRNGLVTRWRVRRWLTAVGNDAENPVR